MCVCVCVRVCVCACVYSGCAVLQSAPAVWWNHAADGAAGVDRPTIRQPTSTHVRTTSFSDILPLRRFGSACLQCFDAIGWAAGRASGL